MLANKVVYQFRDDLHTLPGPYLTGNKSRKFKYLLKHLPDKVDTIVSHGGVQSNAMVALAALGMATKTSVVYYCKKPGRWLTSNPSGNYHRALSLGIELHYLKNDEYSKRFPTTPMLQPMPTPPEEAGRSLWVPQGGAMKEAQELPKILDPFIPFGSVDKRILNAWREAKEAGMYLDLVYGAVAVHTVMQCWRKSDILNGRQVMFVNTGGLEGVASMMNRYKHAGMVDDGEFD
ncbi:hypothetical protein TrRE_jg8287 [Triparma retinervis]|uniref:1-aminocyclopropane-1-carboxylate deaminase n=1 Tax=Triparma retinervis TaxID=2557542 RepID=A0A9W7AYC6_9STRA|nr:hypothetical protein TrRE_jg8287 [Triparma retinervis]